MKNRKLVWDFFIAHSSSDTQSAEDLFLLLKPHRAFLASQCLIPGDDWDREISIAQQQSLVTVVLVSSKTKRSYYQRDEIAAAIAMARESRTAHRVIPVFLDNLIAQKQMPYGLQIKHGLSIESLGGLEGIARKLKETLRRIRKILQPAKPKTTKSLSKKTVTLSEALCELNNEDLIEEVISPLLQVIHHGTFEFVSISTDHGRAVLSTGHDYLKRPHVLCVQPIAEGSLRKIDDLKALFTQAQEWKASEITRPVGTKCLIDELWFLSPYQPTSDQLSNFSALVRALSRQGIKFIWGDELCSLLTSNVPNVAARLSKYATPQVMSLISSLSKHNEGRAFGFSNDRSILDFYVTAALSAHAANAYGAVRGDISIKNEHKRIHIPINELVGLHEICQKDESVRQLIEDRIRNRLVKGVIRDSGIKIGISFTEQVSKIRENYLKYSLFRPTDFIDLRRFLIEPRSNSKRVATYLWGLLTEETRRSISSHTPGDLNTLRTLAEELNTILRGASIFSAQRFGRVTSSPDTHILVGRKCTQEELILLNRRLIEEAFSAEIAPNEYIKGAILKIDLLFFLEAVFSDLVDRARTAIKSCPSILRDDVSRVRVTWESLEKIESFVRKVSVDLKFHDALTLNRAEPVRNPIRIRVPHPEHLLKLSKVVLVEGAPGCGKTTLLKMLAIKILMKEGSVSYLPCSTIRGEYRRASLTEIVDKFCINTSGARSGRAKSTLIIDGLDEGAFDLSQIVAQGHRAFGNVILSTRSTFPTSLRDESFRVALSPFDDRERDEFFEKWFKHNPELLEQARELIAKHPDLETHTRIPLIATITVALLQNGFIPKTRAEIYAYRLDLLLSKWDRFRGVERLYVDNPDAKRRFLRELAFQIHSSPDRTRAIALENLRDVYEQSLGEWGYNISYDKVLKDLIAGSGILVEDRVGVYTFGHLTFQEHLAGEFIAESLPSHKIRELLGRDWWREPLNFYASTKGNITDLVNYVMSGLSYMNHLKQLSEMVAYAPYTSPGAIQCIQDSLIEFVESERNEPFD